MGYKRGRFTGMIGLSEVGQTKRNQEKWESMQRDRQLSMRLQVKERLHPKFAEENTRDFL